MIPERIVTFPWGADIRRYSPGDDHGLRDRLGWDDEAFVILSTRGWAPIYGAEELIRGFVLAARERPELRLLMLGGGQQSGLIRRIIERAKMIDRVHFPGQVRQELLPRYYRAADLYISASHSDGTSISLLEAMSCGRPVLVSDIPGNREWIESHVNGWLFPEGDVNALARAILYAADSRDQLVEMGQAARKLAQQRADWEKNFPRLFEAYQIAVQE
jgi:glycosyltransferase involved in cell wall biosynthesis